MRDAVQPLLHCSPTARLVRPRARAAPRRARARIRQAVERRAKGSRTSVARASHFESCLSCPPRVTLHISYSHARQTHWRQAPSAGAHERYNAFYSLSTRRQGDRFELVQSIRLELQPEVRLRLRFSTRPSAAANACGEGRGGLQLAVSSLWNTCFW